MDIAERATKYLANRRKVPGLDVSGLWVDGHEAVAHCCPSMSSIYAAFAGAFSRSSIDFTITYNTGMKNKFSTVETIIPPNTVVPTE